MIDPGLAPAYTRFAPREGALLDLDSLLALAAAPDRAVALALEGWEPGAPGIVLEGLELEGDLAPGGPPGTRRPDSALAVARVSPGTAAVRDAAGRLHLLTVDRPLEVPWPSRSGAGLRGVLVLGAEVEEGTLLDGFAVARDDVFARLGFVRPERLGMAGLLPLAVAIGNGRDWATDLHRRWGPEHPALALLDKRLARLEQAIWNAEPEGAVWERQTLGRNWVRYQTTAAAALQAALMTLRARPTTTGDRVRVFRALLLELRRTVERAATELLQIAGPPELPGPYSGVDPERAQTPLLP